MVRLESALDFCKLPPGQRQPAFGKKMPMKPGSRSSSACSSAPGRTRRGQKVPAQSSERRGCESSTQSPACTGCRERGKWQPGRACTSKETVSTSASPITETMDKSAMKRTRKPRRSTMPGFDNGAGTPAKLSALPAQG